MYDKQKHKITIVPGWLVPIRKKKNNISRKKKNRKFYDFEERKQNTKSYRQSNKELLKTIFTSHVIFHMEMAKTFQSLIIPAK